MVDQIDFKDITVEEVPATSAVLMGAAHHLGMTLCSLCMVYFECKKKLDSLNWLSKLRLFKFKSVLNYRS